MRRMRRARRRRADRAGTSRGCRRDPRAPCPRPRDIWRRARLRRNRGNGHRRAAAFPRRSRRSRRGRNARACSRPTGWSLAAFISLKRASACLLPGLRSGWMLLGEPPVGAADILRARHPCRRPAPHRGFAAPWALHIRLRRLAAARAGSLRVARSPATAAWRPHRPGRRAKASRGRYLVEIESAQARDLGRSGGVNQRLAALLRRNRHEALGNPQREAEQAVIVVAEAVATKPG